MIDIKFLRENPDAVRDSQKKRGEDPKIVDQLLELDTKRRDAIVAFEALRAEQNQLSKSVGSAKGDEKQALLEKAKELAAKVKSADAKRAEIEAETDEVALQLSNLIDLDAPVGGEIEFRPPPRARDADMRQASFLAKLSTGSPTAVPAQAALDMATADSDRN